MISPELQANLQKILWDDGVEAISVVDPEQYEKNIEKFEKILTENRLKYAIHHVMKANHSTALLRTAFEKNLRADVSSLGELKKAISVGFSGKNITANGPKNTKFLEKSIEIGATIAVDSIEELEKIVKISTKESQKIKILIRIAGTENSKNSRFWIRKNRWEQTIDILRQNKNIALLWIHFHIGSNDLITRKSIFWESIDFWKILVKSGFSPKIINIWWWFGAYYQNDLTFQCEECKRFSLGEKLYQQNNIAGADFLEKFLTDISYRGAKIGDFLKENGLELWLEPGRTLLSENVGFVATTVLGMRENSIILNTNSFSLGTREEELPTNPFLLEDAGKPPVKNHDFSYWILGNLCLESDIVYSRNIPFSRKIIENDIIIFPDMAAYHMDFSETETILHPKKQPFYIKNNSLFYDK